jgi:hypothetical protein
MRYTALALLVSLAFCVPVSAAEPSRPGTKCWVQSSLSRVYPASPAPEQSKPLRIPAARNGRFSFQACVRHEQTSMLRVRCDVTSDDPDIKAQVRRVGMVPMIHHTTDTPLDDLDGKPFMPGLVPDPLFPDNNWVIGPRETQPFWITIRVPANAKPGPHELKVRFDLGNGKHEDLIATLDVSELVIKPRHDFPVTHWWRAEAIWDYYKTGMWEDPRLWTLMEAYLRDYVDHGNDVIFVPVFFSRRETFKRPAQLLKVTSPSAGKYEFDWTEVQRFVDLARKCGIERFEWPHLWIYWGVENPIRVYTWQSGKAEMLWPPDTGATSETYLAFLRQFLPQFHDFLKRNDLLEKSYFHLSDEPGSDKHVANYKRARAVLDELAPWMGGRIMDALSDIRYGREHLTDIPIPMVNAAQRYIDEGIPHWVYYCCAPRGRWLNRFMDTPLPKVRMSGWLFYRLGAKGFLHWGYNYWHFMESERITDPFTMATGGDWPGIPHGDPFVVYPGRDGPIDSLRWEVFAESLQDYAILQSANVKPDDAMFEGIHSYADFPRSEQWLDQNLRRALRLDDSRSSAAH